MKANPCSIEPRIARSTQNIDKLDEQKCCKDATVYLNLRQTGHQLKGCDHHLKIRNFIQLFHQGATLPTSDCFHAIFRPKSPVIHGHVLILLRTRVGEWRTCFLLVKVSHFGVWLDSSFFAYQGSFEVFSTLTFRKFSSFFAAFPIFTRLALEVNEPIPIGGQIGNISL